MNDTFVGGGDTTGTSAPSEAKRDGSEPSVAVSEKGARVLVACGMLYSSGERQSENE